MGRRRSGSISVNVDVDVDAYEILEQITDDALREEVESRGLSVLGAKSEFPEEWHDFADELRNAWHSSDGTHFEVLLLRMLSMAGVPRLTTKLLA